MTPHELEQGRALLAKLKSPIASDVWLISEDRDRDEFLGWLRNHAAELLADSAALEAERAHADRLASVLEGESTQDGEYGVCNACGGVHPCTNEACEVGSAKAAHAARRKETEHE